MADKLLVIFDFDGTLADTWSIFAEEIAAAAARFRYAPIDRERLETLRRLETSEIFKALGVPRWRLPRLVAHLRRRAAERAPEASLFPGMAEAVRTLARTGHTLAIASSNAEPTVRDVLGPDLCACFSHFVCNASLFGKAAKFRKLCRKTRIPASATIAVGDETRDLAAADTAGIPALAVTWGYNDPGLLRTRAPGRTVASPAELLDRIGSFLATGTLTRTSPANGAWVAPNRRAT